MSFAFTPNIRRLFLGAGLHGQSESTDALNLVNLAAATRLHVDLYLSTTYQTVYNEATLENTATTAAFLAAAGATLGIYASSGGTPYAAKNITGVLTVTADGATNSVRFTPAITDYDWTGLTAPIGFQYLRYLLVTCTPDAGTGIGTKIPLFAYDDGDVNGKDLAAGGSIFVDLPLILAIGSIGV